RPFPPPARFPLPRRRVSSSPYNAEKKKPPPRPIDAAGERRGRQTRVRPSPSSPSMDEAAGGYVSPGGLFEENCCFMLDKRALFRYKFDSTLSVKSFKSINKRERVTVTKQTFVLLIIGLYIIVMAIVGIQGARKTKTLTDFVVGGR